MLIINKKTKKNLKNMLIMFVFILFSVIILSGINKRIMPVLIETSCLEVKSFADKTIDNVVRQSIAELGLESSDFISVHNETKTVSADTVLVNNLCSIVDSKLDETFSKQGKKKIAIPLGVACGVKAGQKSNFAGEAVYAGRIGDIRACYHISAIVRRMWEAGFLRDCRRAFTAVCFHGI